MLGTSAWEAGGRLKWGGSGEAEPPQGRRSDADDGGGDGADAPRPNPPQLGPQAHPVQEKISRSGEPLTLIKQQAETKTIKTAGGQG